MNAKEWKDAFQDQEWGGAGVGDMWTLWMGRWGRGERLDCRDVLRSIWDGEKEEVTNDRERRKGECLGLGMCRDFTRYLGERDDSGGGKN